MKELRISVHDLLAASFQSGDISPQLPAIHILHQGSQIHQSLQASRPPGYFPEIPVYDDFRGKLLVLRVQGRIDGIMAHKNGVVLEEIKTTEADPDSIPDTGYPLHLAQARVYGALFLAHCIRNPQAPECSAISITRNISLRLCYVHRHTAVERHIDHQTTVDELQAFFQGLCSSYLQQLEEREEQIIDRDRSIPGTGFPFPNYRKGQQGIIREVRETAEHGGLLYLQAPTGTGKTIAVLYPAIQSLARNPDRIIFYLTPKSSGKQIAENTLQILRDRGLRIKSITLTAKARICLQQPVAERPQCSPEYCSYAAGHYSRVKNALAALKQYESIDRDLLEKYAREYRVCPFELGLDASLSCDIIIGDYNYVFDPRIRLERFFNKKGDYLFLVDEAHNLVDRARKMFSASISKRAVLDLKRILKPLAPTLAASLDAINKEFITLAREHHQVFYSRDYPCWLEPLLQNYLDGYEVEINTRFPPQAMELYYEFRAFLSILKKYDESFRTCLQPGRGGLRIELFCIDPARQLQRSFRLAAAAVLFSGSLFPPDYHRRLISAGTGVISENPSPFSPEKCCILVDNSLSTRYRDRLQTAAAVASRIAHTALASSGNYLAFFPSYAYLQMVRNLLLTDFPEGLELLVQSPSMNDTEQSGFLEHFRSQTGNRNQRSLLGLAVMGGLFAEGIDLQGECLKGAIIVGVGLPQICAEREIIREYFDTHSENGYDFAYTWPGLLRVVQAAGRVIRSEEDRGVILYIGQRFAQDRYHQLLPEHLRPRDAISSDAELTSKLRLFWNDGL